MRHDSVLGNDDDAIADVVQRMIRVLGFAGGRDHHVVPDAGIFVDDGVFDSTVHSDADAGAAGGFVRSDGLQRLIIVAAQQNDTIQLGAGADEAANAHDAIGNAGVIENAAVGNHGVFDVRAVDLGPGKKTRTGEDRRGHVKKVEPRQLGGDIDVRFEEGADRADVLPVTLEYKREYAV